MNVAATVGMWPIDLSEIKVSLEPFVEEKPPVCVLIPRFAPSIESSARLVGRWFDELGVERAQLIMGLTVHLPDVDWVSFEGVDDSQREMVTIHLYPDSVLDEETVSMVLNGLRQGLRTVTVLPEQIMSLQVA